MQKILKFTLVLIISFFYSFSSFAYQGYGKVSKKTGKVRTEIVKGHVKKGTGKYIPPYARSKK